MQMKVEIPTPQEQSEDCLYLNVWSTQSTQSNAAATVAPKPVLVWIYG